MNKVKKWYKTRDKLYPNWSAMTNGQRFRAIRTINKIVGYTL